MAIRALATVQKGRFPGDMRLGDGLHVWEVLLSSTEGGVWIKRELEVL